MDHPYPASPPSSQRASQRATGRSPLPGKSRAFRRGTSFPLLLALRYLRSTRRDAFASFLAAVAAGGIGLGVAALILSLALLSGFQAAVKGDVLAHSPQLEVELPRGADAAAMRAAVAGVRGVAGVHEVVRGRGWLLSSTGLVRPVEIVGVGGGVPAEFPGAEGAAEGLYVDDQVAALWGLAPGDLLRVASPHPTLTPLGPPVPRMRSLPLAGTFARPRAGGEEEKIAVPLAVAESLLARPPHRLVVDAGGLDRARALAGRLAPVLPAGATVSTWEDLHRPLFFVLKLEKALMFVAVFLIVVVAALALVADLALVISAKRGEIGILGAMGATPRDLTRAFQLLGAMIAGLGLAGGGLLGAGGAWVLDRFHLIPLPSRVYVLDHLPFLVRPGDVAAVFGLTFALALAVSTLPARRAAAMVPIEALRR